MQRRLPVDFLKFSRLFHTSFIAGAVIIFLAPGLASANENTWDGSPQKTFLESAILQKYQCTACHTITDVGGTVGPVLNMVGLRRSQEWISRWLKDPNAVKNGTRMPRFPFAPGELEAVVDYLTRMKRPLQTSEIISGDGSPVKKGQALFEDYDCFACHRIGNQGRFVGPDLTFIGIRKTQGWEEIWLRDPPGFKPGTFMPNFQIPDEAIRNLTAFLHTLKGEENEASREWEFMVNFMIDNDDVQRGEMVWKRLGCWSCHGESGKGGVRNPNAAPGHETVPGMRKVRDRYEQEGFLDKVFAGTAVPADSLDAVPQPYFCPSYPKDALSLLEREDLWAYISSLAPKKRKWKIK